MDYEEGGIWSRIVQINSASVDEPAFEPGVKEEEIPKTEIPDVSAEIAMDEAAYVRPISSDLYGPALPAYIDPNGYVYPQNASTRNAEDPFVRPESFRNFLRSLPDRNGDAYQRNVEAQRNAPQNSIDAETAYQRNSLMARFPTIGGIPLTSPLLARITVDESPSQVMPKKLDQNIKIEEKDLDLAKYTPEDRYMDSDNWDEIGEL